MFENHSVQILEANISLMCSNMEQIITLIGNVMEKLKQSCQENSKDTVGSSLELDSLNETVMKRRREPLSWNGLGGLTRNLLKEDQHQILQTQKDLCQRRRQTARRISLKLVNK